MLPSHREGQMSLRRREFIATLGCAAAWPLAVRAQQRAMPVVGWLSTRNSETDAHVLPAFRGGLNGQGYVEGRNVTIEYRWSDTQNDRLPALAANLVHRQVGLLSRSAAPRGWCRRLCRKRLCRKRRECSGCRSNS